MTGRAHALIAIVPCNDLDASEAFYNRLGFVSGGQRGQRGTPRALGARTTGSSPTARARRCTSPRRSRVVVVPGRNPFGLYLYAEDVDALAERLRDDIIERHHVPEHKAWGMYEFAVSDPDGVLVRIGWPTRRLVAPEP